MMNDKAFGALSQLMDAGLECSSRPCIDYSEESSKSIQSPRIDIFEAEKIGEKILEENDCFGGIVLSPLNSHSIKFNDSIDINNIDFGWGECKRILAKRIEKTTGLEYGKGFTFVKRGEFLFISFLEKDSDGDYFPPLNVFKYFKPHGFDTFLQTFDYYAKQTDNEFFCINALTLADKDTHVDKSPVEISTRTKGLVIEGIQVDISFLRSTLFHMQDDDDGRSHETYNSFRDGIMHSISMEFRVISFDSEIIDDFVGEISKKVCFRR